MKVLDAPVTGAPAPQPVNVDGESTFRILEAYKVWLWREHEELSQDLYPEHPEPWRHFNDYTLASYFHDEKADQPPPPRPHTRAHTVLQAVGAIASRRIPADPDPIFAAIAAHRASYDRYEAAIADIERLQQLLPPKQRQSSINGSGFEIVETDAPEWVAAQRLAHDTCEATDQLAIDMLGAQPTTLAGAMALLAYMEELSVSNRVMPDHLHEDGTDPENPQRGQIREWAFFAHRMLAEALYTMADAKNCPQDHTPVVATDGKLCFLSNRAFADMPVRSRSKIVVINPETCFDRPPRERRRLKSDAA